MGSTTPVRAAVAIVLLGVACRPPVETPNAPSPAAWNELRRLIDERIRGFNAAATGGHFPHGDATWYFDSFPEFALCDEWVLHDGSCNFDRCPEARIRGSRDAGRFSFEWPREKHLYLAVKSRVILRDRDGRIRDVARLRSPACATFALDANWRWKVVAKRDLYDGSSNREYWMNADGFGFAWFSEQPSKRPPQKRPP
jgi:hypothetical protein